jgi:branched-chain amino acid transport system substrate-binding protein
VKTFAALAVALLATTVCGGSARAAEPLKIGVLMSFSGSNAIGGQEADAAINTFLKLRGSTVAGRTVQIIKADTGGPNPDVAARRMQEWRRATKSTS